MNLGTLLDKHCCETHNSSISKRKNEIANIEKAKLIAKLKFELGLLKSLGDIIAFHDEMVQIALKTMRTRKIKYFEDGMFWKFTFERTKLSYADCKELTGIILDSESQRHLLRSTICSSTICSKEAFIPAVLEFIDMYCREYYFLPEES